ncbi:MAG TPA: hypothetical protein VGS13_16440 [Stellaceae bacterium]|nr:hypothetical protein [Stellaceae bacterium]
MPEPGAPVEIIFDPHVANACVALALALVAAFVAFILGLPDQRRRRR